VEPRGGRWRVAAAGGEVGVVVSRDGRWRVAAVEGLVLSRDWRWRVVTMIGDPGPLVRTDGVVQTEVARDARTWEA